MNNKTTHCDILDLVKSFTLNADCGQDLSELKNIAESLQFAGKEDVVFYKLRKGELAWEQFLTRYRSSNHGLLIICGNPLNLDDIDRYIIVREKEFVYCQSLLLDLFYPFNPDKTKLVAITGTNGKTSVVNLSQQLIEQNNEPCVTLGTLGVNGVLDLKTGNIIKNIKIDSQTISPPYIFNKKVYIIKNNSIIELS